MPSVYWYLTEIIQHTKQTGKSARENEEHVEDGEENLNPDNGSSVLTTGLMTINNVFECECLHEEVRLLNTRANSSVRIWMPTLGFIGIYMVILRMPLQTWIPVMVNVAVSVRWSQEIELTWWAKCAGWAFRGPISHAGITSPVEWWPTVWLHVLNSRPGRNKIWAAPGLGNMVQHGEMGLEFGHTRSAGDWRYVSWRDFYLISSGYDMQIADWEGCSGIAAVNVGGEYISRMGVNGSKQLSWQYRWRASVVSIEETDISDLPPVSDRDNFSCISKMNLCHWKSQRVSGCCRTRIPGWSNLRGYWNVVVAFRWTWEHWQKLSIEIAGLVTTRGAPGGTDDNPGSPNNNPGSPW